MENLLNALVRELILKPDALKIEKDETAEDGLVVYRVIVDESDMGRIIGRQGRIAKSIRSIARAAAVKNNLKIAVEIG
ncbi:MAG: KH domain-containing protein [Clostridia bacterium]|nr:KH domain-containing protein [Clostridia bacterium]